MDKDFRLFANGFFYVFLVSANTYCIAKLFWIGIALFGFLISLLWTVNVRRIVASNVIERFIYAMGACTGGLLGVYASQSFYTIIH